MLLRITFRFPWMRSQRSGQRSRPLVARPCVLKFLVPAAQSPARLQAILPRRKVHVNCFYSTLDENYFSSTFVGTFIIFLKKVTGIEILPKVNINPPFVSNIKKNLHVSEFKTLDIKILDALNWVSSFPQRKVKLGEPESNTSAHK